MPIFLLKQKGYSRKQKFRSAEATVVRAASEQAARKTASQKCTGADRQWLDPVLSSCEVVRLIGPPTVILEVVDEPDPSE